jgi:hypothetical protein
MRLEVDVLADELVVIIDQIIGSQYEGAAGWVTSHSSPFSLWLQWSEVRVETSQLAKLSRLAFSQICVYIRLGERVQRVELMCAKVVAVEGRCRELRGGMVTFEKQSPLFQLCNFEEAMM